MPYAAPVIDTAVLAAVNAGNILLGPQSAQNAVPETFSAEATQTVTWTSATAPGSVLHLSLNGSATAVVEADFSGVTTAILRFFARIGAGQFQQIDGVRIQSSVIDQGFYANGLSVAFPASQIWQFNVAGLDEFEVYLDTAPNAGSIVLNAKSSSIPMAPSVVVKQNNGANNTVFTYGPFTAGTSAVVDTAAPAGLSFLYGWNGTSFDPIKHTGNALWTTPQASATGGPTLYHANANVSATNIKNVPTSFFGVTINTKGASGNTLTIYDNTSGTANVVAVIDTTSALGFVAYCGGSLVNGLTYAMATGTAADVTFVYK